MGFRSSCSLGWSSSQNQEALSWWAFYNDMRRQFYVLFFSIPNEWKVHVQNRKIRLHTKIWSNWISGRYICKRLTKGFKFLVLVLWVPKVFQDNMPLYQILNFRVIWRIVKKTNPNQMAMETWLLPFLIKHSEWTAVKDSPSWEPIQLDNFILWSSATTNMDGYNRIIKTDYGITSITRYCTYNTNHVYCTSAS